MEQEGQIIRRRGRLSSRHIPEDRLSAAARADRLYMGYKDPDFTNREAVRALKRQADALLRAARVRREEADRPLAKAAKPAVLGDLDEVQKIARRREVRRKSSRKAYLEDPEAARRRLKEYYLKNKEKHKEAVKAWKKTKSGQESIARTRARKSSEYLLSHGDVEGWQALNARRRAREARAQEVKRARFRDLEGLATPELDKPLSLDEIEALMRKHRLSRRDLVALTGKSWGGIGGMFRGQVGPVVIAVSEKLILLDQHSKVPSS